MQVLDFRSERGSCGGTASAWGPLALGLRRAGIIIKKQWRKVKMMRWLRWWGDWLTDLQTSTDTDIQLSGKPLSFEWQPIVRIPHTLVYYFMALKLLFVINHKSFTNWNFCLLSRLKVAKKFHRRPHKSLQTIKFLKLLKCLRADLSRSFELTLDRISKILEVYPHWSSCISIGQQHLLGELPDLLEGVFQYILTSIERSFTELAKLRGLFAFNY